jgi:4-amino-4-deoxychorismate lyase
MLVNGQPQESLSLSDRAIHYGDGLFETILVRDGRPVFWHEHLQRLQHGAKVLNIPCDIALFQAEAESLLNSSNGLSVLKLILSRGAGGRGYTPPTDPSPTRILQLHPLPEQYAQHSRLGVTVQVCRHPVSRNPALAGIKHLNRLDQVLASQEITPEASEGLMSDSEGLLVEGVKSNVFIVENGILLTPRLDQSGIAGIMRDKVLGYARGKGLKVEVTVIPLERALEAQELFVCNSVFGIWPIVRVIGASQEHAYEIGPITASLVQFTDEIL